MIDFYGRRFRAWHNAPGKNDYADFDPATCPEPTDWCALSDKATLVTSKIGDTGLHAPVIDLDVPHHYDPSTTPGHGHLYINKGMTFGALVEILEVLRKHGLVESGIVKSTKGRGYSAVRTPWTRKGAA